MKNHRRLRWLFPFIALAALAGFGFVVMLLWNAIIPGLTGWALLTFWKAVGLVILCKILFGGFPGRRGGHGGPPWTRHARMREKWGAMTEEERMQFREKLRGRCGTAEA
ncbi:MAG: hypothetical protein KDC01_11005 [Flavobacteriales bacterium]|jgi:hypothetical protein|nr:hypothetical protein [Flavobacteriales bacterium]